MIKRSSYQIKKINSLKIKIKTAVICIILLIVAGCCFPHFFRNDYNITIVNKRIIKQSNGERFLIYAQLDDGRIRVFENKNSLLELKINAEDIYYGLQINRRYEIKAYGFEVPLMSYHQNISRVKGIKSNFPYFFYS